MLPADEQLYKHKALDTNIQIRAFIFIFDGETLNKTKPKKEMKS